MLAQKRAIAMVQTQIMYIQSELMDIPEDGNPEYLYKGFLFADTVEWLKSEGFEIRTETTEGWTKNYITPRHDLKLTDEELDFSLELCREEPESLDGEYSDGESLAEKIDNFLTEELIKSGKLKV